MVSSSRRPSRGCEPMCRQSLPFTSHDQQVRTLPDARVDFTWSQLADVVDRWRRARFALTSATGLSCSTSAHCAANSEHPVRSCERAGRAPNMGVPECAAHRERETTRRATTARSYVFQEIDASRRCGRRHSATGPDDRRTSALTSGSTLNVTTPRSTTSLLELDYDPSRLANGSCPASDASRCRRRIGARSVSAQFPRTLRCGSCRSRRRESGRRPSLSACCSRQ